MATATVSRTSPPPTPPLSEITRGTPPPEETGGIQRPPRCQSPDKCPICLDVLEGKDMAYSDNCAQHRFCYECILEWCKQKRECPLCKLSIKRIIHNIRGEEDFDVHTLPPLPPTPPETHLWRTNVTWEWMSRLRREFILSRQRQLLRIQDGTARPSTLGLRTYRPVTADRRRYIYQYSLYCEGAQAPGGGTRFRRVTPGFFRTNPATTHRLVPWLNRELIAVLPHSGNIQFVIDRIISEIKRVDMRSPEFRAALRPFLLRNTDHFIHEFHQFSMSPYDMAAYDRYAKYPPRPNGTGAGARARTTALDLGLERHGLPTYPRLSSSSDSDIDVISRVSTHSSTPNQPSTSSGVFYSLSGQNQPSTSSQAYSSVPPPSVLSRGATSLRRMRTSWHRHRLLSEEGSSDNLSQHRVRHTRWDNAPGPHSASQPYVGFTANSRSRNESAWLTSSQRGARNRLERSLRAADSQDSLETLRPKPSATATKPVLSDSGTSVCPPIVSRVRSFLSNATNDSNNDATVDVAAFSLPTFEEFTRTAGNGEGSLLSNFSDLPSVASTSQGYSATTDSLFPFNHTVFDSSDSSSDFSPLHVPVQLTRSRSPSVSSSHSSDVILIGEEKPYRARTPIELSSENESEQCLHVLPLQAATSTQLTDSSSSTESGESDAERQSSSSCRGSISLRSTRSPSSSLPITPCAPASPSALPSSTLYAPVNNTCESLPDEHTGQRAAEVVESSDSDCIITFEAAKPKHVAKLNCESMNLAVISPEPTRRKDKKRRKDHRERRREHKHLHKKTKERVRSHHQESESRCEHQEGEGHSKPRETERRSKHTELEGHSETRDGEHREAERHSKARETERHSKHTELERHSETRDGEHREAKRRSKHRDDAEKCSTRRECEKCSKKHRETRGHSQNSDIERRSEHKEVDLLGGQREADVLTRQRGVDIFSRHLEAKILSRQSETEISREREDGRISRQREAEILAGYSDSPSEGSHQNYRNPEPPHIRQMLKRRRASRPHHTAIIADSDLSGWESADQSINQTSAAKVRHRSSAAKASYSQGTDDAAACSQATDDAGSKKKTRKRQRRSPEEKVSVESSFSVSETYIPRLKVNRASSEDVDVERSFTISETVSLRPKHTNSDDAKSQSTGAEASPLIDVERLESGSSSADWYLDYTQNDYKHPEEKNKGSSKNAPDIRRNVRYFVKNNIAGKYENTKRSRNCKKHNKGHKNVNK